jgi:flagellar M-ring protein FliF
MLARAQAATAAFTRTQLVTIVLSFAAVVGLVGGSAFWLSRPDFALLFSDMDPEAAADVVSKLEAQKVHYRIEPGGRGIRVPVSQLDRLRLEFSSRGLPSSGRIGFELFDRTAFGATEFLEHVNYRRALEGEIARTIATLSEVAAARVHIAMAKDSLFGARQQPAKASVVLKLRSSRPLDPSTVHGIANLVAASVEGLRPDAVVIVDSQGRPLARPPGTDDEPAVGAELERQQRIERDLAARLVSMLEPVVGANRVRVTVAARLAADTEERTEETWDPATAVVRSRQHTSDVTPAPGVLGGVAGARANLPPPAKTGTEPAEAAAVAATAAGMASRSTETLNYEISRTTRHTVRPRGNVARLSVAVILDDAPVAARDASGTVTHSSRPRQPADLQKLHGLVAAAAGIDPGRGDQLTIENISFDTPVFEEVPAPGLMERYAPQVQDGARIATVLTLALLVIFFVLRPMMAGAGLGGGAVRALPAGTAGAQLPGAVGAPRSVREIEGEIEAQLDAAAQARSVEHLRVPVLTKKANAIIQSEPENAVRLLRSWINEEPS